MAETNGSWIARKDSLLANPMQAFWKSEEERMRRHRERGTKPETGLYWFDFFFIRHRFVPNCITVIRASLTPLLYYYLSSGQNDTAFFLFTTIVLSDLIDGILARGFFNTTRFGKVADPVADKLATTAIIFGFRNDIPDALFWGILSIAVILTGITLVFLLIKKLGITLKRDFGASSWGKYKFASECIGYACIFGDRLLASGAGHSAFSAFAIGTLYLSVAFGILSIISYIVPSILSRLDSYKT